MNALYTAHATATGDGRNGHARRRTACSTSISPLPKEMGGAGGATNPEQLFAAGYAACFHSALKVVGRREKADVDGSVVDAEVGHRPERARRVRPQVALERHTAARRPGDGRPDRRRRPSRCARTPDATRGNIDVTLCARLAVFNLPADQASHIASSFVTVAQLRAVPSAGPPGRLSTLASSLRPKPSGVCR